MNKQAHTLPKDSFLMIDRTYLNFEDCFYEVIKINDSERSDYRFIEIKLIKWKSRVIDNNCSSASHNKLVESLVKWINDEFKGHLFIYDDDSSTFDEEDKSSLFWKLYLKHSNQIQNEEKIK